VRADRPHVRWTIALHQFRWRAIDPISEIAVFPIGWWRFMIDSSAHTTVQLSRRAGDKVIDVLLRGHVTEADGQVLLDSLCDVPRGEPIHVVLDLSAVSAIDDAAAKAILDVYLNTVFRRGSLTLTGLHPAVRDSLREAGVLHIVDPEPAAFLDSIPVRQLRLVHGNRVLAGASGEILP